MRLTIDAACVSHAGLLREKNEDNFLFNGKNLRLKRQKNQSMKCTLQRGMTFAVFDGIGGENFGEQASHAAAKQMSQTVKATTGRFLFPKKHLQSLVTQMNTAVFQKQEKYRVSKMGTTMVSLYFTGWHVYICNVGDSRAYLFRNGKLEQLSVDHVIKRPGSKKKAPLTRYLGTNPEEVLVEPDITKRRIARGDVYLICSDGLTDMLTGTEITDVMSQSANADANVERLLQEALKHGGRDNITAIVCRLN